MPCSLLSYIRFGHVSSSDAIGDAGNAGVPVWSSHRAILRWLQVDELYTVDDVALLDKCYGVIFLFKWKADLSAPPAANLQRDYPPNLWFANQVINLPEPCYRVVHIRSSQRCRDTRRL